MVKPVAARAACIGAALALAVPAGAAGAREEVASTPTSSAGQPPYVVLPLADAYAGVVAWSERELTATGENRYFLAVRRGGQRVRLPIAPREAPFDVDLGPLEDGGLVAVYSRCQRDPDGADDRRIFTLPQPRHTLGRGCDVYRYDFSSGRESKIQGASTDQASEVLPSIWKDRIAFARVYERRSGDRGRYPYLYTRRLAGGASDREPGGSRGTNGLPGPVSLDLYGRRLSFVWNYSTAAARTGAVAGVSEVRLNTVRSGSHRLLSRARFRDTEYATFLTPQGADGRLVYGFQRVRTRGERPPESRSTRLLRYRIGNGERERSVAPSQLLSSAVDGDAVVLGIDDDVRSFGAGGRIVRDDAVRFR